jgi:hypothetical protein
LICSFLYPPEKKKKYIIDALLIVIKIKNLTIFYLRHESRRIRATLWGALSGGLERFKSTVRCAGGSADLDEIQMHAAQGMWKYNQSRPDMALGGITPKQRLANAA